MASRQLTPEEDREELRGRKEHFRAIFPAANEVEEWLLERLAAEALTLERCERQEAILGFHLSGRSAVMWDDDRRIAVLDLAAKLPRDPERIAVRLRATSHGCDLMIERWEDLAIVLERKGGWEERHQHRAMDLLGLSAETREDDPLGLATQTAEELVALIAAEIDALESRKAAALDQLDVDERNLAERGQFVDVPKALALVRRYKAESYRRFTWLWSQLGAKRPKPSPSSATPRDGRPDPAPDPDAAPPPPPPPPPPSPTAASGFTEEEIRRREALLAIQARRVEAERIAAAVLNAAPASRPMVPAAPPQAADLAPRPDRRARPDPKALKRRRRR